LYSKLFHKLFTDKCQYSVIQIVDAQFSLWLNRMTKYHEEFEDRVEGAALTAAGAGAAAGAGMAAMAEVMSLAVGGTAVVMGAAPLAILGAVAGLAAYGLTKLFSGSDDKTAITPLYSKSGDRTPKSVEVSDELLSGLETFFLYGNADFTTLNPEGYDLCGEEDRDIDISG
jgi:hypothetical protein